MHRRRFLGGVPLLASGGVSRALDRESTTLLVTGACGGPERCDTPDDPSAGKPLESFECAVIQYAAFTSTPEWWRDDPTAAGSLERFDSEAEAWNALDLDDVDVERRDDVERFIAETNFDDSAVYHVVSVGPNTCYNAIGVTIFEDDPATIVEVVALESRYEDQLCASTIIFPSALLRLGDVDTRSNVVITIVDGWENEAVVPV